MWTLDPQTGGSIERIYSRVVLLVFECAIESVRALAKMQIDSVGLRWDVKFSISHRCPGFDDVVEVGSVDQQQRSRHLGSSFYNSYAVTTIWFLRELASYFCQQLTLIHIRNMHRPLQKVSESNKN